jgi:hypothetical protein
MEPTGWGAAAVVHLLLDDDSIRKTARLVVNGLLSSQDRNVWPHQRIRLPLLPALPDPFIGRTYVHWSGGRSPIAAKRPRACDSWTAADISDCRGLTGSADGLPPQLPLVPRRHSLTQQKKPFTSNSLALEAPTSFPGSNVAGSLDYRPTPRPTPFFSVLRIPQLWPVVHGAAPFAPADAPIAQSHLPSPSHGPTAYLLQPSSFGRINFVVSPSFNTYLPGFQVFGGAAPKHRSPVDLPTSQHLPPPTPSNPTTPSATPSASPAHTAVAWLRNLFFFKGSYSYAVFLRRSWPATNPPRQTSRSFTTRHQPRTIARLNWTPGNTVLLVIQPRCRWARWAERRAMRGGNVWGVWLAGGEGLEFGRVRGG